MKTEFHHSNIKVFAPVPFGTFLYEASCLATTCSSDTATCNSMWRTCNVGQVHSDIQSRQKLLARFELVSSLLVNVRVHVRPGELKRKSL